MSSKNIEKRMVAFEKYLDYSGLDHNDYQHEGVKWCLTNELNPNPVCGVRGGFIADEMGLGKTIMMIGLCISNYMPKTLIIMPPILIDQWYAQIFKTTGHKSIIYHGENKKNINIADLERATIVLSTYNTMIIDRETCQQENGALLHKVQWSRIIFDEAHHLRNEGTRRYMCAKMLRSKIRWLVSGTPVQNKKKDFFNLCSAIRIPSSFYTDPKNLRLLAKSFILKRTKKQVGIIIPNLVLDNNIIEWKNQMEMKMSEELHSALSFSNVSIKDNSHLLNTLRGSQITLVLRARQSCILPRLMASCITTLVNTGMLTDYASYKEAINHSSKLDSVISSILERKGNNCGKLIFCHFREEIDEIASRLRNGGMNDVITFDGRASNGKRNELLTLKHEALIIQIQTGCEGLNLQEHYSEIYFISPHWNPAIEDQAIARCHRIGQTKPVFVQRFEMCKFIKDVDQSEETVTIDKYINNTQDSKRIIATECIDSIKQ